MGRQPQGRDALALSPALVVEGHGHVAGLVQHTGVVGQVQVLDARVPVAQQHRRPLFAGRKVIGRVHVTLQLESFAVKLDCSLHL